MELENELTYPHNFECASLTGPRECEFCKHKVTTKNGTCGLTYTHTYYTLDIDKLALGYSVIS